MLLILVCWMKGILFGEVWIGVELFLNLKNCVIKFSVFWLMWRWRGRMLIFKIILEVGIEGIGFVLRSLMWVIFVFFFLLFVFLLYVINFFYVEVVIWLKMIRLWIWILMELIVFLELGGKVIKFIFMLLSLNVILWLLFLFNFRFLDLVWWCLLVGWMVEVVKVVVVIDLVLFLFFNLWLMVVVSFFGFWVIGILMYIELKRKLFIIFFLFKLFLCLVLVCFLYVLFLIFLIVLVMIFWVCI